MARQKIPSKQLHRAGSYEQLQSYLSEREIGINTTDHLAYFKFGGELYPCGGSVEIPSPNATSVLMGDAEGNSEWKTAVKDKAPYDEEIELWVSLDGLGFAAEYADRDSDGHLIKSSVYQSYTSNGRANPPVYAPVNVEKKMGTGFVALRMGNGNDLGGLVPIEPPTIDGEFAYGDVLIATTSAKPPFLKWVHPDTTPQKNSKNPTTSGAVYNVRYLLDPNLYDPNSSEELELMGTGLDYKVGHYYVFDDTLYRCDESSSTYADFVRVSGLVTAVNALVDNQNLFIAKYDRTTFGEIVDALNAGKAVVLDVGQGVYAYYVSYSSGGAVFRTLIDNQGYFREYVVDIYASGWTTTVQYIQKVYVAKFGETTASELGTAIAAGYTILLPNVKFGSGRNTMDMMLVSQQVPMTSGSTAYYFSSGLTSDGKYGIASLIEGQWTSDIVGVGKTSLSTAEKGVCPYRTWVQGDTRGTYKSLMSIDVPAGCVLELSLDGAIQYFSDDPSRGYWSGIMLQLAETDSYQQNPVDKREFYVRSFINGAINEATVSAKFVIPAQNAYKTYYLGAYNSQNAFGNTNERLLLASNITGEVGLAYTKVVWQQQ